MDDDMQPLKDMYNMLSVCIRTVDWCSDASLDDLILRRLQAMNLAYSANLSSDMQRFGNFWMDAINEELNLRREAIWNTNTTI